MAHVEIDTDAVEYPSWWAGSTTVKLYYVAGGDYTVARADTSLSAVGVSVAGTDNTLTPWHAISAIARAS